MKHSSRITIAALLLSLTACATDNMSTSQRRAVQGGAIGAGVGAIIGNQSGNALEGAAIGGAVGGLGGAVMGQNEEDRKKGR